MVYRTSAIDGIRPVLVKRCMYAVGNHWCESTVETFQGILSISHFEECFHYIFLHIRAGVLKLEKLLEEGIVPTRGCKPAHDGHRLYAVVGIARVGRMSVGGSIPT